MTKGEKAEKKSMLLTIDNECVKEEVYYDIWTDVILIQETDVTGQPVVWKKCLVLIFVNNLGLRNSTRMLQGYFL